MVYLVTFYGFDGMDEYMCATEGDALAEVSAREGDYVYHEVTTLPNTVLMTRHTYANVPQ